MEWERFVKKNPPQNMSVGEFLRKYPPRDQMDAELMQEILERGPRTEEERQKMVWYFKQWIEPEDRLVPDPLGFLHSARDFLTRIVESKKGKGGK